MVDGGERIYGETHRAVLTYMRSRKLINHQQFMDDFKVILDRTDKEDINTEADIGEMSESVVALINSRITQHGFKIDKKNDEVTGELHYIFVNTSTDGMSEMNSRYTANELVVIKEVIENIVESYNYGFSIGRINAQQIIAGSLKRTIRESAYLIDRLIDDGWFRMTTEEKLVLSLKALSELRPYMIDRYGILDKRKEGKLLVCHRCNDLVTIGLTCHSNDCPVAFHQRCLDIQKRIYPMFDSCMNSDCGRSWTSIEPKKVGVDIQSIVAD